MIILTGLKHSRCILFLLIVLVLGYLPIEPVDKYAGNPLINECGIKYICNYSRKDYNNQSQNWSIVQDRRGIIYAANHGGVMEFDGTTWREIPVPNHTVRSLAMDHNGTIYIGGVNEIGFLVPNLKSTLEYASLIAELEEENRNFSSVWRTHSTKEGIYFWTSKFLFLWDYKQVKVWKANSFFDACFLCEEKLYIRQRGVGLLEMKNGSLELIPGGKEFAAENLYLLVPYDSRRLLLGTRGNGIFMYDGKKAVPFLTEADSYLKEKELYYGIRLSSGDYALATRRGGLVVIDSHGRLKYIFNKSSGLQDNSIKYVFEDFQGNLWLALDEGITKIEYTSPISLYDDSRSNLPGIVLSVVRYGINNDLYAGTTRGLFFLASPGKYSNGEFRPVAGIAVPCWDLLPVGKSLLAATRKGVLQIDNSKKTIIIENRSFILYPSRKDKNRIWVGTVSGLVALSLKKETGQWEREHQFEHITDEIRTMVEDGQGNLWLGTQTKGVLRVDFPEHGTIAHPAVTMYDTSHGLPPEEVQVFSVAGHVMFATANGIFRFDEKNNFFIPDNTLGDEFAGGKEGRGVFRLREDKYKNIWMHSNARNIQAIAQPDGTFIINKNPFFRIPLAQVNAIYPDPFYDHQVIWFASHDGLLRYDTKVKKNYDLTFQTLIRKVWFNGKLIFDGYKSDNKPGNGLPVVLFKNRNLRFEFAAPFFEAETETQYQCLLEGYDNNWTLWNRETRKDYTNLDAGPYTFRVRARTVYETISREDVFQFKVLPPWYKSWWAFFIYAAAAFFLVFFIVKWRSWKLIKEKQRLEQIIESRTKEIVEKSRQLEEQSEKLKEMDKIKSRFFANISHDFRTPLTLILGPLEQMLTSPQEKEREQKKKMRLMLRNSQRLLNLINQLLELSRFDSGTMKLRASRQNIVPILKGLVDSFESLTTQNELDLKFHSETKDIFLYFDAEKIEKAVCNLVFNAVKFTPPGGKITVTLRVLNDIPPGVLEISVCDTGIGIPEAQLEHIFDHFYQVDCIYEPHHKGSGIGLAISREMVVLHHGTITAHSPGGEGAGTRFVIKLPMGDAHLKPGEIVASLPAPRKLEVLLPVGEEYEEEELEPGDKEEEIGEELTAHEKDIILVVEDSADVREYIRSTLEPLYTVKAAKDGEEGITKAREIIPDLIICDIMMPGINGYEACRILKKDIATSHIPVILLTARASEENIIEGLEIGADDYITKPFNTRILRARIKNLIDIRSQLQLNLKREMTLQPVKISVSKIDREFLKDLQEVLDQNISDPDFNVDQLRKKLYMGHTTLYRKIHALSGENPTEFIRSYRLKKGAELLKNNFGTVLEVAFEVGFSSANYFTKCFKKKFQRLPTDFKEIE